MTEVNRRREFAMIADVFAPLAAQPEALGLLDDAGQICPRTRS